MRLLPALTCLAPLPALAEPPSVVADIAPVHSLVAQVMEGISTPVLLVDGSADAHSVQLKPSQAKALADADIVFWVGEEMTPWLERALDGLSGGETVALLDLPETITREFGEDGHDDHDEHEDEHAEHDDHDAHDDHEDEHAEHDDHDAHDDHEDEHAEHDEHDGHDDHEDEHAEDGEEHHHDHSGTDPHAWLTPENGAIWLSAIAEELAHHDPDNADAYKANAIAAIEALEVQDAEIEALLAPHKGAEIVVFHDAFGYFTEHYGIEVLGSIKPGDASAPSAAALSELQELVAEHGVACVFGEPQSDPRLLEVINAEVGANTGILDPTGAAIPAGPALFGDLLRANAEAIAACIDG